MVFEGRYHDEDVIGSILEANQIKFLGMPIGKIIIGEI
jgi:hypothetical protein